MSIWLAAKLAVVKESTVKSTTDCSLRQALMSSLAETDALSTFDLENFVIQHASMPDESAFSSFVQQLDDDSSSSSEDESTPRNPSPGRIQVVSLPGMDNEDVHRIVVNYKRSQGPYPDVSSDSSSSEEECAAESSDDSEEERKWRSTPKVDNVVSENFEGSREALDGAALKVPVSSDNRTAIKSPKGPFLTKENQRRFNAFMLRLSERETPRVVEAFAKRINSVAATGQSPVSRQTREEQRGADNEQTRTY